MADAASAPTEPSDRPIFVLACCHRTGSTLLQRLLNSCPGVLVWGEQGGYLNGFLGEFRALLDWESRFAGHRRTFLAEGYDNFVPNVVPEEEDLRAAAGAHVRALFGDPAARLGRPLWGFKEVRYGADVALFLQRCFPEARFIHLTRDIVDCFLSLKSWEESPDPWNREWTKRSLEDWQRINASFLEGREWIRRLLTVRYEDLVADPPAFVDELSRFLELPRDAFDPGVAGRILTYDGDGGTRTERLRSRRADLDEEERALLSTERIAEIARAYGYSITF